MDHARANRTAEKKSQYHISDGEGVRSHYIYDFVICNCDIASGVTLQHDIKGDFATCDSNIALGNRIVDDKGRGLKWLR